MSDFDERRPLGYIECPDEGCDQVAEIKDVYTLPSTDGPVRHVIVLCVLKHHFDMPEIRDYGEPS